MSGAVVLRVLDYGGQDGTTAQEGLPASDTVPYSYTDKGQDGKFTQISSYEYEASTTPQGERP